MCPGEIRDDFVACVEGRPTKMRGGMRLNWKARRPPPYFHFEERSRDCHGTSSDKAPGFLPGFAWHMTAAAFCGASCVEEFASSGAGPIGLGNPRPDHHLSLFSATGGIRNRRCTMGFPAASHEKSRAASRALHRLTLQLPFPKISESMGNHDSKIVGAGSVD
jgi:hypothetical protein